MSDPVTPVAPPAHLQLPAGKATPATAARDFEAVFLGELVKPMMESVSNDGPFSGGHGELMFRGILAEEFGKAMAARGGIGLAPAVEATLIQLQERQRNDQ